MSSELIPASPGNYKPACLGKTFITVPPLVTARDKVNSLNTIAALPFSTKNIKDPTPDHIEYEQLEYSNNDAISANTVLGAARGDKADIRYYDERTIGKVEERSTNTNLNISLVDFLRKPELQNATADELEEAGIIDAVVTDESQSKIDEEDYTKDL